MVRLLRGTPRLIVHDVREAAGLVLQEAKALCVVKVRHMWHKARDAFGVVLLDMTLEEALLGPVLQTFVGKVDAELIKGVGAAREVLGTGQVEQTNEGGKVVTAETLVDVLVEPCEEQRVERFCEVVSVVRCAIRIKEHGAKLLFDKLRLVRQHSLKGRCLDSKEIGNNLQDIGVADNSGVFVSMTVDGKFEISEMEDGSD